MSARAFFAFLISASLAVPAPTPAMAHASAARSRAGDTTQALSGRSLFGHEAFFSAAFNARLVMAVYLGFVSVTTLTFPSLKAAPPIVQKKKVLAKQSMAASLKEAQEAALAWRHAVERYASSVSALDRALQESAELFHHAAPNKNVRREAELRMGYVWAITLVKDPNRDVTQVPDWIKPALVAYAPIKPLEDLLAVSAANAKERLSVYPGKIPALENEFKIIQALHAKAEAALRKIDVFQLRADAPPRLVGHWRLIHLEAAYQSNGVGVARVKQIGQQMFPGDTYQLVLQSAEKRYDLYAPSVSEMVSDTQRWGPIFPSEQALIRFLDGTTSGKPIDLDDFPAEGTPPAPSSAVTLDATQDSKIMLDPSRPAAGSTDQQKINYRDLLSIIQGTSAGKILLEMYGMTDLDALAADVWLALEYDAFTQAQKPALTRWHAETALILAQAVAHTARQLLPPSIADHPAVRKNIAALAIHSAGPLTLKNSSSGPSFLGHVLVVLSDKDGLEKEMEEAKRTRQSESDVDIVIRVIYSTLQKRLSSSLSRHSLGLAA